MRVLCFCLLFLPVYAYTQNTFAVKVQVLHNKSGAQKAAQLLVDNQYHVVTDDAGIFVIALRNGTNHIRVTLPSSAYKILYPAGGYIAIPRDLNDVPQLIIGSADDDIYLSQYINLYQLIKKSGMSSGNDIQALNAKMDSLQAMLIQLHYTESDLRIAKQTQDEKDAYYPEITADIIEYQTRINNVVSTLKYVSNFAFENGNALQQLSNAVTTYNTVYDKLNRQHFNYEKHVQELWGDSAGTHLKALNSFILDSVHGANLTAMQESNNRLNEYFIGRKKDAELKKQIQLQIENLVNSLQALLPKLNIMVNKVQTLLNE